ncbi:MAG: hypothetical protein N3D11_14010 [Candidatus Sumerlaeia bacterium]|nr:hypothetical protein [Candidatus Sumerlaeia bacterium]
MLAENNGTRAAGPFWVEVRGSRTGGLMLDRFFADPFGGGVCRTAGVHTIICYADRLDQVIETDETDNYAVQRNVLVPPH